MPSPHVRSQKLKERQKVGHERRMDAGRISNYLLCGELTDQ